MESSSVEALQQQNILPVDIDWLFDIPCAVCKVCKCLIGEGAMESVSKVSSYVKAIESHFARKSGNQRTHDRQLNCSRAELMEIIRERIVQSEKVNKVQVLPASIAIEPLPILEIVAGYYCPAKDCSYCCHKETSIRSHVYKNNHGSRDQYSKCTCDVQKGFGNSFIRVKKGQISSVITAVTTFLTPSPTTIVLTPAPVDINDGGSSVVAGDDATTTTTTTTTTTNFLSYIRECKLLVDSRGTAVRAERSYPRHFGWTIDPFTNNYIILKSIRYKMEAKEGSKEEEGLINSLNEYHNQIDDIVNNAPLHFRTLATAGVFKTSTGASITARINLNVEAVTAKKYFKSVRELVFFIYRLADEKNEEEAKKLGFTEDTIKRSRAMVDILMPKEELSSRLLSTPYTVRKLLVELYKDKDAFAGREPLVMTFIRSSSVNEYGSVVSAEVIHKISVALLHSIKKLVVCDLINAKTVEEQEEIADIASGGLVFRTLIHICSNIQPFKIQQSKSMLPSERGDNALAFGENVLHYKMLPILANDILYELEDLIKRGTFGMKLPDVAYLLPGATNNAAPIIYAGEYDNRDGRKFIRYTVEMMESKFFNHLRSIQTGIGSQYTVKMGNGNVDFRTDKLIAWNEEFGNEINLRISMIFMVLGGGIPRCSEVVEAKYRCEGDSGYDSTFHVTTEDKVLGYLLYHNKSKNVELNGGVMRYLPQRAHTLIAIYLGLLRTFNEFCNIEYYKKKKKDSTDNSNNQVSSSSSSSASSSSSIDNSDFIQKIRRQLFLYNGATLTSDKLREFFATMASKAASKAAGVSVIATVRTVRQLEARSMLLKAIPNCYMDHRIFVGENPTGVFTLGEMSNVPWVAESIARLVVANHSDFGHSEETHLRNYDGIIGGKRSMQFNLGFTASRIIHLYLEVTTIEEREAFSLPYRKSVVAPLSNISMASGSETSSTTASIVSSPPAAAANTPETNNTDHDDTLTTSMYSTGREESVEHILLPALRQMVNNDTASFTPSQSLAIRASLDGQDILVVNCTGSGKSICYQLPIKVCTFNGKITIVVVPSIVLMNVALQKLRKEGISCMELSKINSQSGITYNCRVLVTTPEALCQSNTGSIIGQLIDDKKVERVVVDEAHTILTNDPNFRSTFSLLKYFIISVPVTLLTATLRPSDVELLTSSVGMSKKRFKSMKIIRGTIWRENIAIGLIRAAGNEQDQVYLDTITATLDEGKRTIIYCMTRIQVDQLYAYLKNCFSDRKIWKYHGEMQILHRNQVEEHYIAGNTDIVIATSAFGVGVHSSNIDLVLILQGCYDLYEFAQYVGRVARGSVVDNMKGQVLCIYNANFINSMIVSKSITDNSLDKDSVKLLTDFKNFCDSVLDERQCIRFLLTSHFDQNTGSNNHGASPLLLDCKTMKADLMCSVCAGSYERFDMQLTLARSTAEASSDGALNSNSDTIYKSVEDAHNLISGKGYCIICIIKNGVTGRMLEENNTSLSDQQRQTLRHDIRNCNLMKGRCLLCTKLGHARSACILLDVSSGFCRKCGLLGKSHRNGQFKDCNMEPLAIRLGCLLFDGEINRQLTTQAIAANIFSRQITDRKWLVERLNNPLRQRTNNEMRNYMHLLSFWWNKATNNNS